jgi:hypothetical protein
MFVDLQAENVVHVRPYSSMSMKGCSVSDNNVRNWDTGPGVVLIDAMGKDYSSGALIAGDAKLRLEGCTFIGNTPSTVPVVAADNRGTEATAFIYSDSAVPAVCTYEGPEYKSDVTLPCENSSSPEPLGKVGDNFLTAADAWLLEVKQVRSACSLGCCAL